MVLYEALERVTAVPFPLRWAPTPGRARTCSPSDCHGGLFPFSLADCFLNFLCVLITHHVAVYFVTIGSLTCQGRHL